MKSLSDFKLGIADRYAFPLGSPEDMAASSVVYSARKHKSKIWRNLGEHMVRDGVEHAVYSIKRAVEVFEKSWARARTEAFKALAVSTRIRRPDRQSRPRPWTAAHRARTPLQA